MTQLQFRVRQLPRTTTRQQWQEIHQWRRILEKVANETSSQLFAAAAAMKAQDDEDRD
jgi:hypothetical protein